MGITQRDLIKQVQTTLPRGAPFDLPALQRLGVSPKRAAYYAHSGWLVRLGQGVYAFPNDPLTPPGALLLLQQRVPGLHVGGKSALALHGIRHNLGAMQLVLWGDTRVALPGWFTQRFPARYVGARLFATPHAPMLRQSLATPPDQPDGLLVSVPERAALEMLYEVGTRQGLEEARNLFDGLRNLRKDVLTGLLKSCTSVKTVRLFLAWARETQVVDVDALPLHALPAGSSKRWMTRLKDGTLLSLKPHG